jgi:uncharacterized protein YjdB
VQHKATLLAILLASAPFIGACGASTSSPTAPSSSSTGASTGAGASTVASTLAVTGFTTLSEKGETRTLAAMVTYTDGTIQDRTAASRWASANESVATVNAAGLVTAIADGHTTVTATFGNLTGEKIIMVDLP